MEIFDCVSETLARRGDWYYATRHIIMYLSCTVCQRYVRAFMAQTCIRATSIAISSVLNHTWIDVHHWNFVGQLLYEHECAVSRRIPGYDSVSRPPTPSFEANGGVRSFPKSQKYDWIVILKSKLVSDLCLATVWRFDLKNNSFHVLKGIYFWIQTLRGF